MTNSRTRSAPFWGRAQPLSGLRCQEGRRRQRTEAGGPSEKPIVSRHRQALGADLIAGAGHRRGLHQTPIAGRGVRGLCATGNRGTRPRPAREPRRCPRPGLLKAAGGVVSHAEFGSDSAAGPPRGTGGRSTQKMSGRDGPLSAWGCGSWVQRRCRRQRAR